MTSIGFNLNILCVDVHMELYPVRKCPPEPCTPFPSMWTSWMDDPFSVWSWPTVLRYLKIWNQIYFEWSWYWRLQNMSETIW